MDRAASRPRERCPEGVLHRSPARHRDFARAGTPLLLRRYGREPGVLGSEGTAARRGAPAPVAQAAAAIAADLLVSHLEGVSYLPHPREHVSAFDSACSR